MHRVVSYFCLMILEDSNPAEKSYVCAVCLRRGHLYCPDHSSPRDSNAKEILYSFG